jgi:hypothetical protein
MDPLNSFWEKIKSYSTNPTVLLSNLHVIKMQDPLAGFFCNCFEEDKSPMEEFDKIPNVEQKNDIRKAAQYVSETLYEKASNAATWEESLPDLEKAQRFASIISANSSGFFQSKNEQNDADYVREMIASMICHRRDFVDAFNELKLPAPEE